MIAGSIVNTTIGSVATGGLVTAHGQGTTSNVSIGTLGGSFTAPEDSHTGSGVIYEAHFYAITDDGIAECFEIKSGNKVWEERLKGSGSRNSSWSSMTLVDGKIYVPNQSGDVFVLKASPKFELLATNSVREHTNASLAASDGDLFLRTDKSLWCFAKSK